MHRSISQFAIYLFIVLVLGFSSCKTEDEGSDKIKIVTTTNILKDVVDQLVTDDFEVESLMGPGVDPHLYKASHGDIKKLSEADLIVYNGLHLEGKMSEVLEKLSRSKKVVALGDGVDKSALRAVNEDAQVYDPHIWFDIPLWKTGVDYLSKRMQEYFPQQAIKVANKTAEYDRQMDSTHVWCLSAIQQLDSHRRILITSHDAFGYFGDAYSFQVKGLQGISTLSESGLKDVTDMVNFIIDNDVKAVFVESSVRQKALLSVIEGCARKGHEVSVGGELFSDALGEARTPEGSYLGMIKFNLSTIISGLHDH